MKTKILLYDIEVSRDIVAGYGNKWDFKVVKTIKHQELMCFAYKWMGEKKVKYVSRHDYKTYKEFVEVLWKLLNEANITIAHNGNRFDNKMANRFFIKEGFGPVKPYRSIDTLQVARREFKFQSNSLNDLCDYLEIGSKKKITYADLEDDFMSGNPSKSVERLMKQYNIQDVVLLEQLYFKLRPFIRNHPNLGDLEEIDKICPKCGSPNLKSEGTHARRGGRVQSYSCTDCGGWCNEATIKRQGRTVNA